MESRVGPATAVLEEPQTSRVLRLYTVAVAVAVATETERMHALQVQGAPVVEETEVRMSPELSM